MSLKIAIFQAVSNMRRRNQCPALAKLSLEFERAFEAECIMVGELPSGISSPGEITVAGIPAQIDYSLDGITARFEDTDGVILETVGG
jgi:hypothetical protein